MKKYISFVLIAVLFAACTPNNEVGTPFKAGQEVSITAHMPKAGANHLPGKQRVAGVDNGAQIDLTWNEGDQITVKVGDATAVFTLESGAGTANGTFVGEMPASGTNYSVVYPANYNESVLAEQTYTANGFGNGLMKMSTKVDGTIDGGFMLTADNALLGLQLTGDQALSEIVLTNTATSQTYTLNCAGITLTNTATLLYLVVPAGEWPNGFTVSVKDSEGNEITSFTKADAATFSATTSMIMPVREIESVKNYEGIGVFSISATKQVTFSPGNLQYTQSTNTWSFASAQWEMIGTDNVIGGRVTSSPYSGDKKEEGYALADKVDLFGWSTSANNFGVRSTYTADSNYYGSFVDWGTNKIGNDAPNTWRTLTDNEWEYLLNTRPNASSLKGVAQVNGVNGLILLPDNWTCPSGITFKSGFHNNDDVDYYAAYQTFTADQWSKMETAGAIFLPAAGFSFYGYDVRSVRHCGYYWSATEYVSDRACNLFSHSDEAFMGANYRRYTQSVRLVKDL